MRLRAAFSGVAAVALLAGCSSGGNTDYAQYYKALRQGFSGILGNQGITRDQAAAVAYASMGYRLNGGPENLLVLATDTGGKELWTSKAHIVIATEDGRIIRTVGLAHDRSGLSAASGRDLPPPSAALKAAFRSTQVADIPDIGIYASASDCTGTLQGLQTIVILGSPIQTMLVNEVCANTKLRWSFTDSYWVDQQSGFVWRSVQHLNPQGDVIQTEIFRPPG